VVTGIATTDKLPVTAAVLAGGRSMRMGVDKTLLDVDGEALLARVVEVVGGVCADVIVVTNRPEAVAEAGIPAEISVLVDEVAYQGPLGGLVTALKGASQEWVLAVAADMPWVNPDVVRALWDARDGAQVVVPLTDKGVEPLLALYHRDCLPAARRVLETGRRRIVAFFSDVTVVEIPVEALRDIDPELASLFNINTPEDLAEAREVAAEAPDELAAARPQAAKVTLKAPRAMPSERAVTVYMNDVEVATVQATPSDLEEMGVGFLVDEGLLVDREQLGDISVDAKRGLVYVTTAESVPDDLVYKTRYITSGCGKGVTFSSMSHAQGLDRVMSEMTIGADEVYALVGEMARLAEAYRDSGGMHACALARDGRVVLIREDVGRHNALDKVLGRAWLDRIPTTDAVLLTTGRVSYEMAVKAAKNRVPVVVSRSAVTDLAAQIADELGITVAGYARGGGLTVYTHPARIRVDDVETGGAES
jgi:formate dehydrogenase accessory protein FdhD